MLAVRGIWAPERDSLFFGAQQRMTRRTLARVLAAVCRASPAAKEWPPEQGPVFTDLPANDPDRAAVEALAAWGAFQQTGDRFQPDEPATRVLLARWLTAVGLPVSKSLSDNGSRTLSRGEAAVHLWRALRLHGEWFPARSHWLQPGADEDADGVPDAEDPLPFDRNNDNIPDRLQPPGLLQSR
jgi:hypothetical protein